MQSSLVITLLAVVVGFPRHSPLPNAAATPAVIVFSGGQLKERIVLRQSGENARFFALLQQSTDFPDTTARQGIDVAMFYLRSSGLTSVPADSIPLSLADMRATYYPPLGARKALLVPRMSLMGYGPRLSILSDSALAVLARHGIPTSANVSAPPRSMR